LKGVFAMDEMLWVETLWNPLAEMKKSLMEDKESVIKVAAYCRVSESTSKEIDSLINQINHYTLSIYRRSNWKFVGIYYDKGRTGANYKNRIGFKRLIRHAKEGRIDYIITKSISRFSRNTKELIEIANGLKEINVGIYFEKENIDTLIGNTDLLLSLYGAINQQEIEDISNVTRWGYGKRFIKGIPKFSKFLGYEVIDNQGNPEVKIIESEARVVQTIFDMYLNGSSQAGIARYLMQNDIKTTRGNTLWTSNNVRHILTNIAYSGDKLARAKTKNIFTNVVTSSDEIRTQYLIENSHPPIISKETFARTQELLKNRSNLNKKAQQGPFIKRAFSGRLTCGLCGRKYHSGRSRGINYWRCRTNRVSSQLCKSKFFSDKKLKEMIIIAFQRRFDFNSSEILITLLKIIEKINQNDYFEFHRLKYLTEIEIEKENNQRLEKLQDEYKNFEIRIQKIEEDRQYRDAAISWIKGISSTNEFIDAISIEHTRAWVMEITAYSENDFIVQWIDDITTEIGDCNSFKVEDKVFENGALDDNELTFKPIEGRDDNLNKAVKMSVPKAQSSVLSNIKNKYKNSEIEVIYKEVPKRESKLRVTGLIPDPASINNLDYSILNEVIGYIMQVPVRNNGKYKISLPDWDEKIKFNNISEYESYLLNSGYFQVFSLEDYLSNNSDFLADSLRDKLNEIYCQEKETKSGDDLFWAMVERLSPKAQSMYQTTVFTIMAKYFETCDIFEEPIEEGGE